MENIMHLVAETLEGYKPEQSLFDLTDLQPWDFEPDVAEHLADQLEPPEAKDPTLPLAA